MGSDLMVTPRQIDNFAKSMLVERKGSFGRLLPASISADTFIGNAVAPLYKNDQLAQVAMRNPESLWVALREAAVMGLVPGTDEYALTVREGRVLGVVQYQGHIKRMYNFGTVLAVHADVIAEGERLIRRDPDFPVHEVPNWEDRDLSVDRLRGAFAYATLQGGVCSRVVHMGRKEIMKHRHMAATRKDGSKGIWDGDWGKSMWIKTTVHELEKWVPKSAAFQALEAQQAARLAEAQQADLPRDEPILPRDEPIHAEATTPPRSDGEWDDVVTVKPGEGR